jgi:kynureninase
MRDDHEADPGIRRLLSGTPPVIALAALDAALDAFDGVDMRELRRRSVELGERFIAGVDAELSGFGFELATPREAARRGSQVSLRHEHAFEIVRAAACVGVIGDYREPGICRFGLAPLYTDLHDVDTAIERLAGVMAREDWRRPEFAVRSTVT